jgi:proteasome lid subunit RPN8/RPN11
MSAFEIICGEEQMTQIEEHCFSETRIEVGGFLIGKIEGDKTTVTQAIAAQNTIGQSTQLTFTHDTWNAIYAQMADLPTDEVLIGWYHSHPNFGVFLSEHDQFIQNNFFKNKGQITIVVDPIRGRSGWFRSVEGKIRKYGEEVDTLKPRLGVSATNADANMDVVLGTKTQSASNLKIVAISGIMAIISFVAGLLVNSLGHANEQQAIENKVMQQVRQQLPGVPSSLNQPAVPNVAKPQTHSSQATNSAPQTAASNPPSKSSAPTSPGGAKQLTQTKKGAPCAPVSQRYKDLICGSKKIWITAPVTTSKGNVMPSSPSGETTTASTSHAHGI